MNHWTITNLELKPHQPQILHSTDDARAIALLLPAGESLDDHEVHERTWLTVLAGEVEVTTVSGESVSGGCGLVVECAAGERRTVHAHSDSTIMLLLTPWPGAGHPGGLTLEQKANAQTNAAEHRASL
jgi:quercetin dioxygenase-like cupin family protein